MSKKIEIILIIFIVLNLIMMGVLTALIRLNGTQEELDITNTTVEQQIDEYHGRIYPENFGKILYSYEGDIDLNYFYEMTYKVVNYIPDLNSVVANYSEEQLKSYYNQNKDTIQENTGITTFAEFNKLCSAINKLEEDSAYEGSTIDTQSYEDDEDYVQFVLDVEYSNSNKIQLIVRILNKYNEKTPSIVFYAVNDTEE